MSRTTASTTSDGTNDNKSWNCGIEGPTEDPAVEKLRTQQVKNFLTVTTMSLGIPMLLMGDEVRRTQLGNNNAYCHDDESNWLDWSGIGRHRDILRFLMLLNARRVLRDEEHERRGLTLNELLREGQKAWHGVKLGQPDWSDHSYSLAFEAALPREGMRVYLILNAYWEPLEFQLPTWGGTGHQPWRRWIDTGLRSPDDITPWQLAPSWTASTYRAHARSAVVLFREELVT